MARIHLFLDNARYHHAKIVQDWMKAPGRRIALHLIPAYRPHLDPIERLWREMHENITHNRCYEKFAEFSEKRSVFLGSRFQEIGAACETQSLTISASSHLRIFGL